MIPSSLPKNWTDKPLPKPEPPPAPKPERATHRPWEHCYHPPSLRGNPLVVQGRLVCGSCATYYLIAKEAGAL